MLDKNEKVYMAQMFNNVLRFNSAPNTRHLWIQTYKGPQLKLYKAIEIICR